MRYLYKSDGHSIPQRLLFISLKETVLFPCVVVPLFFHSDEALALLNRAVSENNPIGCVGQHEPHLKDPQPKIFVGGLSRVLLQNIAHELPYLTLEL